MPPGLGSNLYRRPSLILLVLLNARRALVGSDVQGKGRRKANCGIDKIAQYDLAGFHVTGCTAFLVVN